MEGNQIENPNNSKSVNKAHLAQTAHGAKTEEDVYIGREGSEEDRNELLLIYNKDLPEDPESIENDKEAEEQPASVSDSETLTTIMKQLKNHFENHLWSDVSMPSENPLIPQMLSLHLPQHMPQQMPQHKQSAHRKLRELLSTKISL